MARWFFQQVVFLWFFLQLDAQTASPSPPLYFICALHSPNYVLSLLLLLYWFHCVFPISAFAPSHYP